MLVSVLIVVQALLSGDTPLAQNFRHTVTNPRDTTTAMVVVARSIAAQICYKI